MHIAVALSFLALLLPSAATAEPSPDVATLQSELTLARAAANCPPRRSQRLARARSAVSAARDCLYAGLPYPEYAAKRAVCQNRSEARHELRRCEAGSGACKGEKRMLDAALAACERIGWNGTDKKCPALAPLLKAEEELERIECPSEPQRGGVRVLEKQLADAVEKRRKELGLSKPPYEIRTYEPGTSVPDAVVIMLHGLGSTAVSQFAFAKRIYELSRLEGVRFLMPTAPVRLVSFLGFAMPAWFNVLSNHLGGPEAKSEIVKAAANVDAIAELQRQIFGIKAGRVLVFGVSQGGSLAQTVYMRYQVGAAVSLAGSLPITDSYPSEATNQSKSSECLVVHGVEDEVVPVELARRGVQIMRQAGRKVTFIEMKKADHDLAFINPVVAAQVTMFVKNVLK